MTREHFLARATTTQELARHLIYGTCTARPPQLSLLWREQKDARAG